MKKYLKIFILILTASFFVLACQDTSDSSSGINSGTVDGGGSSNGDGGGSSSMDSEIINATMRVSADENDALKNTFFSPAIATNGGKLKYTWNFGDDSASVDTDYNYVTHQFNKYGKTYTVNLLLNNMSSSQQETVTMDLTLPKPEISINCNTSGALLFCNPLISQQNIQNVSYTWNIYNSTGTLEKEILSTGPSIINYRVAGSGTYRIVLKGTSAQVDGEMTAERDIYVSVNINQGQITYKNTSSDMLSYTYTFNAQAVNGSQLEYCWDFEGTSRCSEGIGFQLGAQFSIADHTYDKYKAAHIVTAYARIPGTDEVVNNSIIVTQPLPEVSINAEGSGLARKLSPVFSFIPKGNLSYIWKTGDGKEYSNETVNHTYKKNGTYTAELTVLNDLFAPEIGAVSAKPLNIYAYDNIENVVIEYTKVNQTNQGETYTFSSPAVSSNGQLYYIWKVDNAVIAEGENLASVNHTFTRYGQNASVSLDLKITGSNEIISAEPVLVQTSKPVAVLNPPANVTVDVPAEFKGEVLSHINGEDFSANLVNPQYKLEISDVEYKYSNSLTIPYTFITRGIYYTKLVVTADNVEGSIVSEPVTVQANEVSVICRNEANPVDIYSIKVICQPENILDNTLKYSLSYQEYINDVYTTKEYSVEEVAEIILYHREKDAIYNIDTRNIVVNWEIYKDTANSENLGTYQYRNIVQEPAMGQIIDVLMNREVDSSNNWAVIYYDTVSQSFIEEVNKSYTADYVNSTYALDSNGRVYSWGKLAGGQYNIAYPQYTPKLINCINGKVVKMWNDMYVDIFQREDGELYISYILNSHSQSWFVHLKGMKNKKIKFLPLGYIADNIHKILYFITNDGELYSINFNNYSPGINGYSYLGSITPEKTELAGNIKKVLTGYIYMHIITDTNKLYYIGGWANGDFVKKELAGDVVDFGEPNLDGEIVSVKKTDGNIYNLPRYESYFNGNYYDNLFDNLFTYDGSILYNYAGHNLIKGQDNILYHQYAGQDMFVGSGCYAGIGSGLPAEEYTKMTPLSIPDEVSYIYYADSSLHAVTVSGQVYRWGSSSTCTPQLISGLEVTGNIKEINGDYILYDNGKILYKKYESEYIEIPGNPFITKLYGSGVRVLAHSDTGDLYYIDNTYVYKVNNFQDKNIKVSYVNNGTNYIVAETGVYKIQIAYNPVFSASAVIIEGLPNNIKYFHGPVYYYIENSVSGGKILAHTEDNKLYEIYYSSADYKQKAVLIDIPAYKKHLGPERNVTFNNSRDFYTVLTEDGSIYSWGAVEGTGTYEQVNITLDGYVTKPTKVNK